MLRRYLLFTIPSASIFWTLFALSYFGHWARLDVVSMVVSQPCYLLEEAMTPCVLNVFPALELKQETVSHLVLIFGFLLWASLLMLPF